MPVRVDINLPLLGRTRLALDRGASKNRPPRTSRQPLQRQRTRTGATINRQTFSFPGGRRFHFIDPDGYELAVWSADESSR